MNIPCFFSQKQGIFIRDIHTKEVTLYEYPLLLRKSKGYSYEGTLMDILKKTFLRMNILCFFLTRENSYGGSSFFFFFGVTQFMCDH